MKKWLKKLILVLVVFIFIFIFYTRYNEQTFMNTNVLLPIGNKRETLFFQGGIV